MHAESRGAARLRRGVPSVWGVWGAISGPRVQSRGAPRLRRGVPSVWGVWGAISGPPT